MRLCDRLLRLAGPLVVCAGCGASPPQPPPAPPTPWCADAQIDVERLPESLAGAWQDGPRAALDEADALWAAVVADAAPLFHPEPPAGPDDDARTTDAADGDAADGDAADGDAADGDAAPTDAASTDDASIGDAPSDAAPTDAADRARTQRAAELRAWTRTWRDSPRPVVDVGLDRFVPAPDLAEAAIEAAIALDDAAALRRWRQRLDPRTELAACVDGIHPSGAVR